MIYFTEEIIKEIFFIQIVCIFSIFFNAISMVILYIKSKKTPLFFAYINAIIAFELMIFIILLKTMTKNMSIYYIWVQSTHIVVCYLCFSFFRFGYIFYNEKELSKKTSNIVYIMVIIMIIITITDPIHHLQIREYGYFYESYGVLFWVYVVIGYILLLSGVGQIFLKAYKTRKNQVFNQVFLINICVFMSAFFSIINFTGVQRVLWDYFGFNIVFDTSPIVHSFIMVLWYVAIFKYNLIDIMPILSQNALEYISTGLILFNHKNRKYSYNKAIYKFLYNNNYNELIKKFNYYIINNDFTSRIVNYNNEVLHIRKYILDSGDILVSIFDITNYNKLEKIENKKHKEISLINNDLKQKLKIIEASSRNDTKYFIAREIHDILGHSLTLSIKLVELANILYERGEKEQAIEKLKLSSQTINKGYTQFIDTVSLHKEKQYSVIMLRERLKEIIDNIKTINIEIKFYFDSKLSVLEGKRYNTIIRVIQEGITNSIKHGKPKKIILSIRINEEESVEIYIVDNGIGCEKLIEGSGILGLKERISKLDGIVSYSFDKGTGFKLFVNF